jgi:hypothetical protein
MRVSVEYIVFVSTVVFALGLLMGIKINETYTNQD